MLRGQTDEEEAVRLKENKSMEESGKSGKRVPGRLLITTTVDQEDSGQMEKRPLGMAELR